MCFWCVLHISQGDKRLPFHGERSHYNSHPTAPVFRYTERGVTVQAQAKNFNHIRALWEILHYSQMQSL